MNISALQSMILNQLRPYLALGLFATVFGLALPAPSQAGLFYSDKDFLEDAAMGGMTEVALGKLAAEKASDPKVRQFAEMMVSDHTKLNADVKALAAKKKVQLPAALDKKHQEKIDDLSKETGKDFDEDYLECMTKAHKKTLALFEEARDDTKDPDVKALAAQAIPVIKVHIAHLDKLNQK